jgi:hypothetical protein
MSADARVQSQGGEYGACDGQGGTGKGFCVSTLVFPYQLSLQTTKKYITGPLETADPIDTISSASRIKQMLKFKMGLTDPATLMSLLTDVIRA